MNAGDIEKCNAEFFQDPIITESSSGWRCLSCTEAQYTIQHAGDKCIDCNKAMEVVLPQLCNSCHNLLDDYARWLLTIQSGGDEDSAGLKPTHAPLKLFELGFSTNCKMCDALKLEGKPYRKQLIAAKGHSVQFTPLGINVLGTPYSITHSAGSLHTYSPLVRWREIRLLIALCDANCERCDTETLNKRILSIQMLLSLNILLIDVDSRCLISISETDDLIYAALSYTWGGPQPMLLKKDVGRMREVGAFDQPNACSLIIRDAILVCRRTGVRYLWVDAYCIPQDATPDELSKHVENMDSIYANAFFTIVAADSASADQGIHGVSIPRQGPNSFNFYLSDKESVNLCEASVGISSAELLANSTRWATRAWTYQEGILSRRLLVFTEELCVLICPDGCGRDNMKTQIVRDGMPLPLRSDQSHVHIPQQGRPKSKSTTTLYEMITEYSARELTIPDDILKAFSGIMTAVKGPIGKMRYGMPLRDLHFALSWKHHILDLLPTASMRCNFGGIAVGHPGGRRHGFPTWSWAGWLHDGAKVQFPGRKLTVKAAIHYVSDDGGLEATSSSSEPDNSTETEHSGRFSCQLTDDEKEETWITLAAFDIPLDSLLILKTIVLRVDIDLMPIEVSGDWGIYVHHFGKRIQPAYHNHPSASPLDDPYRSIVHVSRNLMDHKDDELEFAILGADTSDPKTLHFETIVLNRSGSVCHRVGAADLRFKVDGESSIEEALDRIIKDNGVEIIILG